MSVPYRYLPYTITYDCPQDEAVLLVRRTTRRAGLSTISWKPRNIYDVRRTPFTDHLVLAIYEQRREARLARQE